MDWNATKDENGATIAIAIIRKPAVVPVSHPKYGGVILFNPGRSTLNSSLEKS